LLVFFERFQSRYGASLFAVSSLTRSMGMLDEVFFAPRKITTVSSELSFLKPSSPWWLVFS